MQTPALHNSGSVPIKTIPTTFFLLAFDVESWFVGMAAYYPDHILL